MNPHLNWPRYLQTAAVLFTILATGFLLKVAEAVLVPIALAVLLAFLLHPLVKRLQRTGLPRAVAVVLVVTSASVLVGAVAIVVSAQVKSFADELPRHRANIEEKVTVLKRMSSGGTLDRLKATVESIDSRTDRRAKAESPADDLPPEIGDSGKGAADNSPVSLTGGEAADAASPDSLFGVPMLSTIAGSLGTAGVVAVLVIFFLIYQADIRDRMVVVAGRSALATTTKALEEAGSRISRYLLMQFTVNATYGLAVGIGLAVLGVPYAAMWGLLAGLMRYIPYVGPWVAAVLPIAASLVSSPGWTQPLLVIGLFVLLELISNNVMEPVLYGQSVGLSEVAVILSAVIWAWLWGAVGLVLATPMTVCLVVLGRYVPGLKIFDQLLGEPPPVSNPIRLYQRLLAKDSIEAEDLVKQHVEQHPIAETCDKLLLPALDLVNQDLEHGTIDEEDAEWIHGEVADYVHDLPEWSAREQDSTTESPENGERTPERDTAHVVGLAARAGGDDVALQMLDQMLSDAPCRFEILSSKLLLSERLQRLIDNPPVAVCISALPPGDLAHVRRICKKLRQHLPKVKVLVGRWSGNRPAGFDEQLLAAGADQIIGTLDDMQRILRSTAQVHVAANGSAPRNSDRRERQLTPG